jgi:DNA topoisomerase III
MRLIIAEKPSLARAIAAALPGSLLELAQALYERQLLTYPRSDCSRLPEAQLAEAREVIAAVLEQAPAFGAAAAAAHLGRRSLAWANSKITAHHAIIPTAHRAR